MFPVSLLKAFQTRFNIVYQPSRKHIQHIDRINRIFHIYDALRSFLNGLSHVHTKLLNELNNGVEVDGNTHLQGGETSEYILYKVSGSFGVKGFRIDLVRGNIGVDFLKACAVLAPNPKIAKFVTLA